MDPKGFFQVLEERRSVRKFENRPVPRELIERLLRAGIQAPNAHNTQSWRFAVLTDKADMIRMADGMFPRYAAALCSSGMEADRIAELAEKRRDRLAGAPLAIVCFVAEDELKRYDDPDRDRGEHQMAVQSAALAADHILLSAHALGLGGVWICAPMFAPEEVREALDLPGDWLAQGVLLLGYPAEFPEKRARKPLDEVVVWVSEEAE
jgi:F420 biosynthesis protein FbiB-like protein